MTNYEAIKNLTPDLLEKFLDQVFLTGFNTGYQSLADVKMSEENPFDEDWLNAEVEESDELVEDDAGERSHHWDSLANVIMRIVAFDADAIPEHVCWQKRVLL